MTHNIKNIVFGFQLLILAAILPAYAYFELNHYEKQQPSAVKEKVEKSGTTKPVVTINKSTI